MTTPIFLGVDGGGTSTTAWLGDLDGRVLGRGVGGPSNPKAVPLDAARAGLDGSIRLAFADAGLDPRGVDACCLGLAGYDRPEDRRWLESWSAGSPWPGRLVLANDGDLVVAAGTPEGWGVGLIAGTGSIAVGRTRDGRTDRSGGWGYLFGDEGSGYAVALAGLRKVARRADGREPDAHPTLGLRICEALGIASPSGLVAAVYGEGFDRAKVASLAPLVVEASDEDPSIGIEILGPAARDLALMVEAVAARLGFGPGRMPLALGGSFLLNCRAVARAVIDRLSTEGREVEATPVPRPVEGALALARRGWIRR